MRSLVRVCSLILLAVPPIGQAYAQCAGCGADYNKQDRDRTERERVRQYDKPVRVDPVGNALIGGGVSGGIGGSVVSGARSAVTGSALGTGVDAYQQSKKK